MKTLTSTSNKRKTRWWLWLCIGVFLTGAVYYKRTTIRRILRWIEQRHFAHIGDKGPLLRLKSGVWTQQFSGLWTREILFKRKYHWSRVRLQLLRVDPKLNTLRLWARRKPRTVRWIMRKTRAIAAINGGLFDPKYRPLGYFKTQQKIHNTYQHRRRIDGVVFQQSGHVQMARGHLWRPRPSQLDWAFQSTPLLVADGKRQKLPPRSWKVDRRSALCIDRKKRLILMTTSGLINGLSFLELSLLMATPVQRGGLGCTWGINLDGGSSTQWAVRTPLGMSVTTGISVPTFLLVFRNQSK